MKVGVLGTGPVGKAIANKLLSLGHSVMMGSRSATGDQVSEWLATTDGKGLAGAFADAARHGEVIFNCTNGSAALDILKTCSVEDLNGKTLIDVTNPLDFSNGFPPSLSVSNTDSLAERIQQSFPSINVVKSLNTVTNAIMVNPQLLQGEHHIFVSGNSTEAKQQTRKMLEEFGWPPDSIVDLGDVTTARGVEMYLPLWVRLYGAVGTAMFNVKIVK